MNIIRELEKLCRDLDKKFRAINCGGCCVVAGYVALFLRHCDIDAKVIVIDGRTRDLNKLRNQFEDPSDISNWFNSSISFAHVLVAFTYNGKEYVMDSNGIRSKSGEQDIAEGHLEIREAIALGRKTSGWNSWFDRKQIPGIRRTITKHLKPLRRAS